MRSNIVEFGRGELIFYCPMNENGRQSSELSNTR
jgi:hypothetical protein